MSDSPAALSELAEPRAQVAEHQAKQRSPVVAVVGLGYVGLPLAVEFARYHRTIGFDISEAKIAAYRLGQDPAREVSPEKFAAARGLEVSADESVLREAEFVIIAVPTPVDNAHNPDFGPLISASNLVGRYLRREVAKRPVKGPGGPAGGNDDTCSHPVVARVSRIQIDPKNVRTFVLFIRSPTSSAKTVQNDPGPSDARTRLGKRPRSLPVHLPRWGRCKESSD